MEHRARAVLSGLLLVLAVACATPIERRGQQLFAGCIGEVDDRATLETGRFVCEEERDPAPFAGNGRTCGDCHVPGDHFGLSRETVARLPAGHPLFQTQLGDDPRLLREHALVRVTVPGQLDEFRQTPKLVHLQELCDDDGNCDSLGLLGDRVPNLCAFSMQAIVNHMSRTARRVPDEDFRMPSAEECEALVAYMLSDLVAGQDERTAD